MLVLEILNHSSYPMSILFNPSSLAGIVFIMLIFRYKVSEKKERKKCDLNENENDVLDLPSLEIVTFGGYSFGRCHVAVFESM